MQWKYKIIYIAFICRKFEDKIYDRKFRHENRPVSTWHRVEGFSSRANIVTW